MYELVRVKETILFFVTGTLVRYEFMVKLSEKYNNLLAVIFLRHILMDKHIEK